MGLNKNISKISLNISLLTLTFNRKIWPSQIWLKEKTLSVVQNQKYSASLKEKDGQRCDANSNQIKSGPAIGTWGKLVFKTKTIASNTLNHLIKIKCLVTQDGKKISKCEDT